MPDSSDSVNLFDLLNKESSLDEETESEDSDRVSEQYDLEKLSGELIKRAQIKESEKEEKTLDKVAEAAAVWEVLKDEGVL